jgi:hypothetical protein
MAKPTERLLQENILKSKKFGGYKNGRIIRNFTRNEATG